MQYCYSHLSRDVENLEKEFPDNQEVSSFVQALLPQLTAAMTLRKHPLSKRQYKRQAAQIANIIRDIVNKPASHPGIQHIQDVFREKSDRMYRWTLDPEIPAEKFYSAPPSGKFQGRSFRAGRPRSFSRFRGRR